MAATFSPFGDAPWISSVSGYQSDFGVYAPPGARVFYLCNGTRTGDDPEFTKRLVGGSSGTLSQALSLCRAGMNDTIIVLPGHAENVTDNTMLTNLVASTRVVGIVNPFRDDAPKFTWTNTAGNWAISTKNVLFRGLRLLCDGANGITSAITTTASAISFEDNYISWAAGAALKSTIGITVDSASHDFRFLRNYVTGTETHNVTDGIKVQGATPPARLFIAGNKMIASATAANGLIHVTVASLRGYIGYNSIYNTHTASTACIAVDDVASDGLVEYNNMGTKNNGTASSQGLTFGTGALWVGIQNYCDDEPKKNGILAPTAAT